MDERRARIYDDLRGIVLGDLYFEPLDRMPYAHDASLYEIDPLGVVVPRTEDDVVSVVRYAAENRIPLHVRGAGTDTGGGSLGRGLVVDLSRHLRKVIELGPEHVVVEPGVVLDVVNEQLAPLGRRLEPVPSDSDVTTLGGMIGVDAAGARSMRHGSTGDQVDRLRVVFAQGEVADLGFEPWPAFEAEPTDLKDLIVRKLHTLYKSSQARLERLTPLLIRNRAGYGLLRSASESGIQLGQMVAGSEGTLAIVLQAALRTVPLPSAQGVVLLPFVGLSDAAALVPELSEPALGASSCDLFDRRSISLARDADPLCRGWIDEAAEAILTVEFEGSDLAQVAARVRLLCERAQRLRTLVADPFSTFKRAECERLLRLAPSARASLDAVSGASAAGVVHGRRGGPARPARAGAPAVAEPAPATKRHLDLRRLRRGRPAADTPVSRSGRPRRPGQAGTAGQLGVRRGHRGRRDDLERQGCGLVRTQFLRKQCGELVQVFREIKDAFDPQNQLNPGKIIGDDPHLMLRDLKPWLAPDFEPVVDPPSSVHSWHGPPVRQDLSGSGELSAERERQAIATALQSPADDPVAGSPLEAPVIEPALRWERLSLVETASACHGCGTCRSLEPTARMCPSFRRCATRQRRRVPRPTWSGCWPTARSIPDSGVAMK